MGTLGLGCDVKRLLAVAIVPWLVPLGVARATTFSSESSTCLNEAFPSSGSIIYFCDCQSGASASCVAGNDANAGTSKASPKKNFATAMGIFGSSGAAGSTVAFCDGGSWIVSASTVLENFNATAASPVLARDYLPTWGAQTVGGDGLPIMTASSSSVIVFYWVGGSSPTVRHDEGYKVRNLVLKGNGVGAAAMTFAQGVTDVDVCNVTMDNFANGGGIGVNPSTAPPNTGNYNDSRQARLTFHGCTITNNPGGFQGAGNDVHLNYNYWRHNSITGLSHDAYWTQATDSISGVDTIYTATGEQMIGNDIADSEPSPSGGANQCNNSQIVVHGAHDGIDIEQNTMVEQSGNITGGCYGIQIDQGDPLQEQFPNSQVRDNLIVNFGYVGIGLDNCTTGCVAESNILVCTDANCGLVGMIDVGSSGSGLGSDLPTGPTTIRNNTMWVGSGSASPIGIVFGSDNITAGGHVIANNVFQATNTGAACLLDLILTPRTTGTYAFVDNNLAYAPSASFFWECQTGTSLSGWKTSTSNAFDTHSISGSNPLFTSTGVSGNYTPASGSPLIGAGNSSHGATTDYNSATRPSPPAIGAIDFFVAVTLAGKAALFFGAGF